ncbi:hypothetical protein L218DRAFT_951639 [Marasmius fiardii PR-910]|nr:hypothetical protein L218DRAFT_951639 [Marasmius fiardii PR-910]
MHYGRANAHIGSCSALWEAHELSGHDKVIEAETAYVMASFTDFLTENSKCKNGSILNYLDILGTDNYSATSSLSMNKAAYRGTTTFPFFSTSTNMIHRGLPNNDNPYFMDKAQGFQDFKFDLSGPESTNIVGILLLPGDCLLTFIGDILVTACLYYCAVIVARNHCCCQLSSGCYGQEGIHNCQLVVLGWITEISEHKSHMAAKIKSFIQHDFQKYTTLLQNVQALKSGGKNVTRLELYDGKEVITDMWLL